MFLDWIKAYQDYDHDLPHVGDVITRRFDFDTDELLSTSVPAFFAEGSYSTNFRIHVCGRRITVDGNPSRINRLDNVFGINSLEGCFRVINALLSEYGLPPMTRCTTIQRFQDGSALTNGAVLQRLDLTSNFYVGEGNERAYMRAISSQRYRNSIAYLYPDGNTCVWTPKGGEKAGRLVYPGNYAKAAELNAHLLPKVKRSFGEESEEYQYVRLLRDWCASVGMVRSEIKCRSEFLKREGLQFWGLFDESKLVDIHKGFLMVGSRLEVTNYDELTIAQQLVAEGICKNTKAAYTTSQYVSLWRLGQTFDFNKSAVQEHRARLRRLNIDIKTPYDQTRHGTVFTFTRNVREVEVSFDAAIPSFYRHAKIPSHLSLVAS